MTPSNFNSLLNGSCPEWTNYNLIVKSDRLREATEKGKTIVRSCHVVRHRR